MKLLKAGIPFPTLVVGVIVIILLLGCSDKSTSPNGGHGDWIAYQQFSEGSVDIYRMNPDGSHRINLTGGVVGYSGYPDWSSTREWIAYCSQRDNHYDYDIYVMNSAGGSVTRMTADPGNDLWPQWAPDDSRIAFISNRHGEHMELYLTSLDYHDAIRLTDGSTDVGYRYAWSPDGHTLAFVRVYPGYSQLGDLCLVDDDGSHERAIADSAYSYSRIQWASDGIRILYTAVINGYIQVCLINNDGSTRENLSEQPIDSFDGQWSPDESRIVFTRVNVDHYDIWVMNSDGSGAVTLINSPFYDFLPIWSPDGSKILFERYGSDKYDLYIMDDDGSNPTLLTDTVAAYVAREACW